MSEETEHGAPESGWSLLRSGGRVSTAIEIPTKPSDATGPHGPVRFALGRKGEARLLLPLGSTEDPRVVQGAPALAVEVSTLIESGKPRRFLDLTCLVAGLEAVFARVAEQILMRVRGGVNSVEAASSTIEEFRELLLSLPETDITNARIAGLVGELLVLRRLLDRSPDAWKSWRGPTGARHDFMRGSTALEVKVSLGRGQTLVAINGLEQLREPEGGCLYLQHFELEAVSGGLLSISGLGRAVLAAASEENRVRELLAAVGCADVDDEAWNTTGFHLENETLYQVRSGFPRLIATDLPKAVSNAITEVRYVIDLSSASAFQVDKVSVGKVEALLVP